MIDLMKKELSIEYLQETEIGQRLQSAMATYERVQEIAYAYVNDDSPEQLKTLRVGTVLSLSVLRKLYAGKKIKKYDNEDWKEIFENVAENSILVDPSQYTINVFSTYANYIDVSVQVLKKRGISEDKSEAITPIAEDIRELSKQFNNSEISEVDYTEQCLWLSLEAMIKLLCAYSVLLIGDDAAVFAQGLAMFAFEYGRYSLYRQEQEMLAYYLEHQKKVDSELSSKLIEYNQEMEKRQKEFELLIKDAYEPDVMTRLRSTVMVAKNAGVKDTEVLDSVEKIDDFFL